jgi:type II secretory pathway component GspD/PulD (secretin)
MVSRRFITSLALFLCLVFAQASLGQERRGEVRGEQPKPADWASVQRRLADIQKQLLLLSKEIEALRQEAKTPAPAPAAKLQVRIYPLRNADASEIAKALETLFHGDHGKKISVAVYQRSNSLIVRAAGDDLDTVEATISRLDALAKDGKKAKADGKR